MRSDLRLERMGGGLGQAWVRGCGSCPRRVSRPRPLPVPRKTLHLGQARFQGTVCARMSLRMEWSLLWG